MSTRSRIRIVRKDYTSTSIYCHYDGYPLYNGFILQMHYNTPEKINKLLEGGNLSSLDKTVKACKYYCRDRGESLEFWDESQEFNYTFDERQGLWFVQYGKYEKINSEVLGQYELGIDTNIALIDELLKVRDLVEENWKDEYKGDVVQKLVDNAKKPRAKALKEMSEESDWWYRAYCD